MTVLPGDLLFSRTGQPAKVISKQENKGTVTTDTDLDRIGEHVRQGIQNGMRPEQREAYQTVLSQVKQSGDAHQEIEELYKKIDELKSQGADERLIRYLTGELQFRMTKERYQPASYKMDLMTLTSY